jgi:glycosyltransferase involved in cell wall biosynthesis
LHNDKQLAFHRVRPGEATFVVFNSRWIEAIVPWSGPTAVVRPRVDPERCVARKGKHDSVTLVNLTEPKGAPTFYALAQRSPRRKFLGVKGAYGEQIVPRRLSGNMTVIGQTPRIADVLGATRVLLMPSSYESYGRIAVEALANGIPVVAHPTPGLKEALGDAAVFVDRDDVVGWLDALAMLDNKDNYRAHARCALARFATLGELAVADQRVWFDTLALSAGAA